MQEVSNYGNKKDNGFFFVKGCYFMKRTIIMEKEVHFVRLKI